jgi:hypothetical protein
METLKVEAEEQKDERLDLGVFSLPEFSGTLLKWTNYFLGITKNRDYVLL